MNPLLGSFRLKFLGESLQGVLPICSLEAFLFAFAWIACLLQAECRDDQFSPPAAPRQRRQGEPLYKPSKEKLLNG